MRTKLIGLTLLIVSVSHAQIDMAYRRANATVLYEFLETSGSVVHDTSLNGTPLNLTIADASGGAITWGGNYINIKTRNLIQSAAAATKVIDACKASGEISIETWIENNETAEPTVGFYPNQTEQPNRIVSLATNITKNNFYIGQFYNAGNLYFSAINTSGNENITTPGGNLNNALSSEQNQIIIPSLDLFNPPAVPMQKVIVTLTKDQVARMYLSDRDGNISRSVMDSKGFAKSGANYFNTWYSDAKLSIANVASTFTEVQNARGIYTSCVDAKSIAKDPSCSQNSRYWKGKIYLVAVYCKALSDYDILGEKVNSGIVNKVLPIDPNLKITDTLKKAQDIYQRLTGVKTPLYDPILAEMEKKINLNNAMGAAALVTDDPRFYNVTVKNFASVMSNRAETNGVPLNDFTATVIGAVRDEINAQRLLWDNIVYVADPTKAAVPSSLVFDLLRSNNQYLALENQRSDLAKVLMQTKQKIFDGKVAQDMPIPAGLLTTRAWLSSHAVAGTNRRALEYTFREFLCSAISDVADSTGPDNVVGRDVDRFPGGSHTKFTTTCRACHTIMDGFRPAYGYVTFNSDYVMHSYTSPKVTKIDDEAKGLGIFLSTALGAAYVHDKLNHNETVFPGGRITVDDSWVNDAVYGANGAKFAWTKTSGKGLSEFGKLISESKQFPICMATRVYKEVCKRAPSSSEMAMIKDVATDFATNRNYNLKFLFQKIVTTPECLGGN